MQSVEGCYSYCHSIQENSAGPVTKEELGRATWVFLHTLAAQYPEKPTRQQKKDVKELMAILSRMYPCKDCADHFKEVLRYLLIHPSPQSPHFQWIRMCLPLAFFLISKLKNWKVNF
nr:FAD-linked sulfhydryl oxidase ERV1 [Ipomoea batatas]